LASSASLLRLLLKPWPAQVPAAARSCASCVNFCDAPALIESRIQGLRCMGSAHSSVRSSDGICLIHDRYLAADCSCSSHEPRLMFPMRQGPTAA